jgi:acyl-CoA synthetase (AMP-forming)/AMP-acid ligase II
MKNVIAASKNISSVTKIVLIDANVDELDFDNVISLKMLIQKHSGASIRIFQHVKNKVDLVNQSAMIFLSSGTTSGKPKGVLITQNNLIVCLQTYKTGRTKLIEMYGTINSLGIAPWSHVLGFMSVVFGIIVRGASTIYLPKFDQELYLKCIEVS